MFIACQRSSTCVSYSLFTSLSQLQDCIGSAVVAMGPEKILALIPISLGVKDFSCSNSWLIHILKKNIVGSSLQFFMENIIPLAESFEQASVKGIYENLWKVCLPPIHRVINFINCWSIWMNQCEPCDNQMITSKLEQMHEWFLDKLSRQQLTMSKSFSISRIKSFVITVTW